MRGLVIIWRYGKCGNCSIDASTKYFYENNFVTFYQSYGKQQRNTLSHTSVLKLTYRWPISLAPPLIILTPAVKYFRLVACSMFYLLIGVWCRAPASAPLRAVVSRLYRGQAPGQEPASTSIWKDTGQCRAQRTGGGFLSSPIHGLAGLVERSVSSPSPLYRSTPRTICWRDTELRWPQWTT